MPENPLEEPICTKCMSVATCTINDVLMCELHGMYWSNLRHVPMVRLHGGGHDGKSALA